MEDDYTTIGGMIMRGNLSTRRNAPKGMRLETREGRGGRHGLVQLRDMCMHEI
jgi:hypothetical protein